MKKYVKILLLVVISLGAIFFYKSKDTKTEFETKKLEYGKISQTVTASGVINP